MRAGETRSGQRTLCLHLSPRRLQGRLRSGPAGSSSTVLGCASQGPMPNAGEVHPHTTTMGVFSAAPACMAPVSPVTRAPACSMMANVCFQEAVPQCATTSPSGCCADSAVARADSAGPPIKSTPLPCATNAATTSCQCARGTALPTCAAPSARATRWPLSPGAGRGSASNAGNLNAPLSSTPPSAESADPKGSRVAK